MYKSGIEPPGFPTIIIMLSAAAAASYRYGGERLDKSDVGSQAADNLRVHFGSVAAAATALSRRTKVGLLNHIWPVIEIAPWLYIYIYIAAFDIHYCSPYICKQLPHRGNFCFAHYAHPRFNLLILSLSARGNRPGRLDSKTL